MFIRAPRGGAVDRMDGNASSVECCSELFESSVVLYLMPMHGLVDGLVSCVGVVAGGPGVDV